MPIDRRTKTSARDNDGRGWFRTRASTLPIHAETAPGSDIWTQPIDMRPTRITTGGNDLWVVRDNNFGFGIGQPNGRSDGWILWEPRQRQYVVSSRLQQVGYLHWPTRAFRDLGGTPTYARSNLSASRITAKQVGGETFSRKARAEWTDLWPALPQGRIDLELVVTGSGLKENIRITDAARQWITVNRPPLTPLNETYFGFTFEIDWGTVKDFLIGQNVRGLGEDVLDQEVIQIRGTNDEALGFVTPAECWVDRNTSPDFPDRTGPGGVRRPSNYAPRWRNPVVRRFFVDNGTPMMFVGVRTNLLNQMASGDLIIDPPQTTDTATGNDDGYDENGSTWRDTGSSNILYLWWDGNVVGTNFNSPGFRFDLSAMNTDSVTTATLTVVAGGDDSLGSIDFRLAADDVANAAAFANGDMTSDFMGATADNRTTANANETGVATWPGNGVDRTFDVTSVISELVTSYGESVNNVRLGFQIDNNPDADFVSIWDSNNGSEDDPDISVTQVATGADPAQFVQRTSLMHRP